MPASRKAKRKEAAGESSGRDPSSSSLSLAFSEIEERSAKKYHTECQIEKVGVHAAAKRALLEAQRQRILVECLISDGGRDMLLLLGGRWSLLSIFSFSGRRDAEYFCCTRGRWCRESVERMEEDCTFEDSTILIFYFLLGVLSTNEVEGIQWARPI